MFMTTYVIRVYNEFKKEFCMSVLHFYCHYQKVAREKTKCSQLHDGDSLRILLYMLNHEINSTMLILELLVGVVDLNNKTE